MKRILFFLSIYFLIQILLVNIGFTETKKKNFDIEQVNENIEKINSFIEKQEQQNIQINENINKLNVNIGTNDVKLNSFNEKINIYDKRMDEYNTFIIYSISALAIIIAIFGFIIFNERSKYNDAIKNYEEATKLQKEAKAACEKALWEIQNTSQQIQLTKNNFFKEIDDAKQQIKFIAEQVKQSIKEDNEKERAADQKYREAQDYYYKKEYDNALLKINEAIKLLQKSDFYVYKLIIERKLYDITQDIKFLSDAQTTIYEAIKLYPDDALVCVQYSAFLVDYKADTNNFIKALELVEKAIEINSEQYYFYVLKARINTLLENIESSVKDYKKALDISKNNSIDVILDYMELLIANNNMEEIEKYTRLPIYIHTNNFGKIYIEALYEAVKIHRNSDKFKFLKDRLSKEKEWLTWSTQECKKIIHNKNNRLVFEQKNAITNILNEIDKYKEEYRKNKSNKI